LLACSTSAKPLLADQFETAVKSSNDGVFIFFKASWCGHCKQLTPAWQALEQNITNVKFFEVECTSDDGKELCTSNQVSGYPTLKFKKPNSTVLEMYEGERDEVTLESFVRMTLGPPCTMRAQENCTPESLEKLIEFSKLSFRARTKRVAKLKTAIEKSKSDTKQLLETLQAQYHEVLKMSKKNISLWQQSISLLENSDIEEDEDDKEEL
jgi:thiol-disulfide isomerase/thioredoxin